MTKLSKPKMFKLAQIVILFSIFLTSCGNGQLDIYDACRKGNIESINKIHTKNNAIINTPNTRGDTPLVLACYYNQLEAVKVLLELGASVNFENNNGTALQASCYKNHTEIVRLLLKNNAEPNVKDQSGATALHMAVFNENIEIIKLLLNYNANPHLKDKGGKTPFNYAKIKKDEKIINLFNKK